MNTAEHDDAPRGRGRPRKEVLDDEQRRRRRDRKGMLGYRLQVPAEKLELHRFKYSWVNDQDARIFALTKQDDWNFVHQDGSEIKDDADRGSAINVVVGEKANGQPLRAFLCRKRKDWWEDDQRQKIEEIEEMMNQMRRGNDPDGSRPAGIYPLDRNEL